MLRLTSPTWFEGQAGVVVQEQFACDQARVPSACGIPSPPAKWSPSSAVNSNSVFDLSMPSGDDEHLTDGHEGEERAEGFVVVVQLLHVVGFAGP